MGGVGLSGEVEGDGAPFLAFFGADLFKAELGEGGLDGGEFFMEDTGEDESSVGEDGLGDALGFLGEEVGLEVSADDVVGFDGAGGVGDIVVVEADLAAYLVFAGVLFSDFDGDGVEVEGGDAVVLEFSGGDGEEA
ncbi:MAG: hypothetical protein RI897_1880 [Verrucomicrobiota bacterium]